MSTILVRCHSFAAVRERIGFTEEALAIPAECDDRSLPTLLAARHPDAATLLAPCRIAVDQAFVRGALGAGLGAEIAVIPPVSGG